MIKLASRIFDFYDDQAGDVASTLPSELHSVKLASVDEVSKLFDYQFGLILKTAGDVIRRRYPLHDADAVKLSRAYFDSVKATLHPVIVSTVEAKIASAEAGMLESDVAYVNGLTLREEHVKVAFSERHWGLMIDGRNHFPLHDADLVKVAIARFNSSTETLEPVEKFLYARNIAKRASETGVAIPDSSHVQSYMSDSINLAAVKQAIDIRRDILKTSGIGTDILDRLEEVCGCADTRGSIESAESYTWRMKQASDTASSVIQSDPSHIIQTLTTVDKLANISSYHYLRGMPDPYAACFKVDSIAKRAALIVDGVDLSCVTPESLAAKFDPEFCAQFAKQPVSAYESLPQQLRDVIKQEVKPGQPTPTGGADPTKVLGAEYVNSISFGN